MEIISNGSKWGGESPDPIDKLLNVLATEPLDPSFEYYGGFVHREPNGEFHAHGNFHRVSHVFSICGTWEEIRPIAEAIKVNRKSVEYLKLRVGYRKNH